MPWPAKPLVKKICNYCFKEKWMKRAKAQRFRYCCNKCKWAAKKNYTSHRKIDIKQKHPKKCTSLFCNNVKYYTNKELSKSKEHFCSRKCYYYYISKRYKLDLEILQRKKTDNTIRSIWKL
jgi:hypothetical protein